MFYLVVNMYLKITNSLGIVNFDALYTNSEPRTIKEEVTNTIQRKLLAIWRKILLSNICNVELVDLELNNPNNKTNDINNQATLIISYMLKFDPRIQNNMPIIMQLASIVNITLQYPNSIIYSNLTNEYNSSIAFILPDFKIACKL
jgi:hypothetical protein